MKNLLKFTFVFIALLSFFNCENDDDLNESPYVYDIVVTNQIILQGSLPSDTLNGNINEDTTENYILGISKFYEDQGYSFEDVTVTLLSNNSNFDIKIGSTLLNDTPQNIINELNGNQFELIIIYLN